MFGGDTSNASRLNAARSSFSRSVAVATYTIVNELRRCNNTAVVRLLYQRVSCYLAVRRHLGVHGARRDKRLTASVGAPLSIAVTWQWAIQILPSVRRLQRTLRNPSTPSAVAAAEATTAAAAAVSATAASATTVPSNTYPTADTDRQRQKGGASRGRPRGGAPRKAVSGGGAGRERRRDVVLGGGDVISERIGEESGCDVSERSPARCLLCRLLFVLLIDEGVVY